MSRNRIFGRKTEEQYKKLKEQYAEIYERDYALVKSAQEGSEKALTELLRIYDPFIRKFAKKYLRTHSSQEYDDLYQLSRMGFIDGVKRFELDRLKDVRLTSFVVYRMMAEVQYSNERLGYIIRPGRAKSHVYEGDLDKTTEALSSWISLDNAVGIVDNSKTPSELFEEENEREKVQIIVAEAMSELTERQKDIIYRRFFKHEPETLEQVAQVYKLSRERIRQISQQALNKIQKTLKKNKSFRNFQF